MIKTLIAILLIVLSTSQDGKIYKVTISINNKSSWSGNLEANRVIYPGETFSKGIYLKMLTPVNGDLTNIVEVDNDNYFIPYRFLSGDCSFTFVSTSSSYISLTIKNNPTNSYIVRLDFEAKNITSVEGGKIKNRINFNRSNTISKINEIKRTLIDAAASYSVNKKTYDEGSSRGLDIDAKISAVQESKSAIESKINEKVNSLSLTRKTIEDIEKELANHKMTESQVITKISEVDSLINTLAQNIADLEAQNTNAFVDSANFNNKVIDSANDYVSLIDKLSAQIPSEKNSLNDLKDSLLSFNDLEKVKEKLRTIYP